ncbi:tRNA pseudouridine synthase A [Nitzschia inconspicua]|uniref:tRNA pseudouridine synthase n=1 Tax=Nitzschia inconspicua TaxID=303405 RepID=A0A9K3LWB8_9STRA|nr:tRNA pseudouridine synthase A [Nitzschia inconspicua]
MANTTTTSILAIDLLRKGLVVRRSDGFQRYALSIQYHGGSNRLLGFSYQHSQEDEQKEEVVDSSSSSLLLCRPRSVEGRLRQALTSTFGSSETETNWENIQVSSRTDRGVHAWKNTLHVDINTATTTSTHRDGRNNNNNHSSSNKNSSILQKLTRGLNFHLARQDQPKQPQSSRNHKQHHHHHSYSGCNDIRILSATVAPLFMRNDFHLVDPSQPSILDWNARFSATERTYVYRILVWHDDNNINHKTEMMTGLPFEWDRSWQIWSEHFHTHKMQHAAQYLMGTHDYSSFRGARCQRQSPVVTIHSIDIQCSPYIGLGWNIPTIIPGRTTTPPSLVTITLTGNAFLYRQVRNMVGCLVEVAKGKLRPDDIPILLHAQKRPSSCYTTAPAHGLFLVDVQHGNFVF